MHTMNFQPLIKGEVHQYNSSKCKSNSYDNFIENIEEKIKLEFDSFGNKKLN